MKREVNFWKRGISFLAAALVIGLCGGLQGEEVSSYP